MSNFWDFAKTIAIIIAVLFGIFLILLAIPQSRLRSVFLKVFGITAYFITGLFVLYIINPLDLIADIIPVVGQADDLVGIVGAIITATTGWFSLKKANEVTVEKKDNSETAE